MCVQTDGKPNKSTRHLLQTAVSLSNGRGLTLRTTLSLLSVTVGIRYRVSSQVFEEASPRMRTRSSFGSWLMVMPEFKRERKAMTSAYRSCSMSSKSVRENEVEEPGMERCGVIVVE